MAQPSPGAELIGGLPRASWESIFELLDGASRLALTEAVTELRAVADCGRVIETVTFSPDTDEATLGEYCEKVSPKKLRQLRFTNCLALPSDVLLGFLGSCENVEELCVLNCVVEPPALFHLLSQKLVKVKKLEWSLYEDRRYESWLEKDAVAQTSTSCQLKALKTMYVEVVATPLTADFLEHILNGCHGLQNLHVHAIRKDAVEVPMGDANIKLQTPRPGLRRFRYTCERVPPPTGRLSPEASYSFVLLEDVSEMRTSLQGVRRAVVAVKTDLEASRRFLGAAKQPQHWSYVRSLSLVLLPPPREARLERLWREPDFLKPMREFLRTCLANISELSLTKSHFWLGCNFCLVVGPALSQLRSLALPPCAVNCEDSLQCLAKGCRFLEELDVSNDDTIPCDACRVALSVNEYDIECLHAQTRLWRLSICETAKFLSLEFLLKCRVTDLRLSLDSLVSDPGSLFYFGPSNLFSANERLSTLTIKASLENLFLDSRLAAAKSLRSLCLQTQSQVAESAVSNFISRMVEALPLLQVVHVHYLAASSSLKTMSWISQRHQVVNTLPNGKRIRWQGQLLNDSPCLGRYCCATSFIGVARPRNRS
ncbi:hypothetical protein HPB49_007777 [Dermacentor silvarum]|uniref:Uncharacterized protein n=1 Tax=Dermacentor silvarum TaxID=543639 RepID=A0ACB8DXF1_DERSI|nr:hypothetical protein HPB49_007777 [Dermacentor silvarum]